MNAFTTLPYPEALRDQLWHALTLGAEDLMRLDTAWAQWTGKEIEAWMKSAGVPPPHVVCSHGHTVFHRPDEGWTCQIGHGAVLHALLGVPVVSDLRSLDVAMGGQGAPLVPLADQMLFGDWDVALNLGGFANLSMDAMDKAPLLTKTDLTAKVEIQIQASDAPAMNVWAVLPLSLIHI